MRFYFVPADISRALHATLLTSCSSYTHWKQRICQARLPVFLEECEYMFPLVKSEQSYFSL